MSQSTFALDISRFVEKAKGNMETVVKKVAIDMLAGVVVRSPVGNPELWAINKIASNYNLEVSNYNAALRDNPENLTKAGRLKRGKKIHDSMDLYAPPGYVGGRFRANWQVTFNAPAAGEIDGIDPQGSETIARGTAVLNAFNSEMAKIWFMNNLPYGYPLEFEGHSSQAPGGMVRITVTEFQAFVNEAVNTLP